MKSKIKTFIFLLVFFIVSWILMNISYFINHQIGNISTLTAMMTNGYNGISRYVGMCMPIIYTLFFSRFIRINDSTLIIRYGKANFSVYETKNILLSTLLFVFEYVAVNFVFCIIIFPFEVLVSTKYFLCIGLYFITLYLYFSIIGISMLIIRNVMNFNKLYIPVTAILFPVLTSLSNISVNISPVLCSDFIWDWFNYNTFNFLEYILNIVKMTIVIFIFAILHKLIFLKKDILINEEEN